MTSPRAGKDRRGGGGGGGVEQGNKFLDHLVTLLFSDSSSANSDQNLSSPNNINTESKEKVMRFYKMIPYR